MTVCKTSQRRRGRVLPAFLATGVCLCAAICAFADEPTWPADFAEKIVANGEAAQPGEGQRATSSGTVAAMMCKWHTGVSEFVSLCTKKPRGFVLYFR